MNKFKQPLDLREVVNVLQADLVWSQDFDSIRKPLASLLIALGDLPPDNRQVLSDNLQSFLDAILEQPLIILEKNA